MDLNKDLGPGAFGYSILATVTGWLTIRLISNFLQFIKQFIKWIFKVRHDMEELKEITKDHSQTLTEIGNSLKEINKKLK